MKIKSIIFFIFLAFSLFSFAQKITIVPNQTQGITYCRQSFTIVPNFTMTAASSISALKISFSSGYQLGEDELRLVGYSGIVTGTWYAAQGYMILSGGTNVDDYIKAMRQVQYINNSSSPTNGDRYVTFSLNDADYLPETLHFYRFVDKPGISWLNAKADAELASNKYYGLQGYLATITSEAENNFIQQKTKGVGWIGASDAAFEGDWRWVTGPEGKENNGQGRLFWRGTGYQAKTNPNSYGSVNNEYHNWNRWSIPFSSSLSTTGWEPNNSNDEDYAHITVFPTNPSESYKWNDLPSKGGSGNYLPAGYLIEYGGTPGDSVVNLTATIVLYVKTVKFSSNKIYVKCEGDPVQLNQQETKASYKWSPATGLSSTNISNPFAKPSTYTEYSVVGVNGICRDSAKFVVGIIQAPKSQLKKVENICTGKMVTLDPGLHTAYAWSTGTSGRSITIGTSGKYTVTLTGDKGCTTKDSLEVIVHPYPKMNLTGLSNLVCGPKAVTLNISKDKGDWSITNLNNNQQFKTPSIEVGSYGAFPIKINLTDIYGCGVDTSLVIGFRENPAVNLGNDTTICNPAKLILNAGVGGNKYQWSTGDSLPKIEVAKAGDYKVMVKNSFGCFTKDSVKVSFTNVPKLNLSGLNALICGNMATTVNIKADKGSYQLTSKNSSVTINGMNTKVPAYGKYQYLFSSTDQYGCRADTLFAMGFYKIPSVKFTIDETECYGYNLQATYVGDADIPNARFTWIFAGDTISNKMGQHIETIPLGVGQAQRDLSLTVNENGCTNYDAIKDIHVIPTLTMVAVKPVQCLPLAFDFIGTNTENGVKYLWELGDGTLATTKEVTHKYAKDGHYDVSLTVTTDKGCTNTKTMKKMVYVAPIPTAGFSLSPELCRNPGKDTLRYVGTALPEDTYHWDLKDFDPAEIVQSPETTAGPFVFDLITKPKAKVALFVVSTYGCQSPTASLEVKRKPIFSFKSSLVEGCAPLQVNFKAEPLESVDQLVFGWKFGDGGKDSGSDLNHSYMTPNMTHNLHLSARSSLTGCTDSIYKPKYIVVHPNPKAGFSMDKKIVYNDMPMVNFLDQSSNATNYYWEFGDGRNSRLKDPSHNYEVVGQQKIIQTVYNEFDCQDSASDTVMVAFNRLYAPNAFSPTAASAIDRIFLLNSDGIKKEGYQLTILSRWNDLVFECKNEIIGWDGKMADGKFAPAGNYIWMLRCVDFLGGPHFQTGLVTLVY